MQRQKHVYVAPYVERWLFRTRLTSILESFSGEGDIMDYEEVIGFSADGDPKLSNLQKRYE